MKNKNVLIADDHYIVRLGLKILIDSFEGYTVTKEAKNGVEAIKYIDEVDFCFLDLEMPMKNGIEVLEFVKKNFPDKRVILLTNSMEILTLIRAKGFKPHGFLFKDGMNEELKICLDEVSKGNYYMGSNCKSFFKRHADEIDKVTNSFNNLKYLTKTELSILSKIADNNNTTEIAEIFSNSPKTIDNHRTNIVKKIDITNYHNLQAFALQNKTIINTVIKDLGYK